MEKEGELVEIVFEMLVGKCPLDACPSANACATQ
jgi:hypothetical protein